MKEVFKTSQMRVSSRWPGSPILATKDCAECGFKKMVVDDREGETVPVEACV